MAVLWTQIRSGSLAAVLGCAMSTSECGSGTWLEAPSVVLPAFEGDVILGSVGTILS